MLNPQKVRRITLVDDKKMVTWDDLSSSGAITIYDKGVIREPYYDSYGEFHLLAREGDVTIPKLQLEPLKRQARFFIDALGKKSARCVPVSAVEMSCVHSKRLMNRSKKAALQFRFRVTKQGIRAETLTLVRFD